MEYADKLKIDLLRKKIADEKDPKKKAQYRDRIKEIQADAKTEIKEFENIIDKIDFLLDGKGIYGRTYTIKSPYIPKSSRKSKSIPTIPDEPTTKFTSSKHELLSKLSKEIMKKREKKKEEVSESRINWKTTAYQYSHGKFPHSIRDSGLWMFEINGDQVQYQGKWAEVKKYVENEVKLRIAKGVYGKSGTIDVKVMP